MEWDHLKQELETITMQLSQVEKWKKQKQVLEKQVAQAKDYVKQYEQLLKESASKIERVEEENILNKVKYLFQNKQEELTKFLELCAERELKLTEAQITLEDLQDNLVDAVYKINAVNEDELVTRLQITKIQMKSWLEKNAPKQATHLQELMEREQLAQTLIKEIKEAIEAGKHAKRTLQVAASELSKAKDYSTWDTFLGGGVFVTHLKHEKIRASNSYLHQVQRSLQRFQNELLDVQEMSHRTLKVNVDGFVTFADYFFDDIFSAWSVHSKLNHSRQQIQNVMDDVSNTLIKLSKQLGLTEKKKAEIYNEIEQIYNTNIESLKL